MSINNQPTIQPRTVTGIFTKYIAKTLPLAFDESMSYYECLCAMLEYLNDTIVPDINNVNDGLGELQNFYNQLQTYVNDYFSDLNVQDEINTKLDSMVTSGELANIINQDLFNDIQSKIVQNSEDIAANSEELERAVKYNEADSITMEMLNQEVLEALTGGSTAVVGTNSVGEENIKDGAITVYKLDDYLQSTKSISYGDPKDLGERYAGMVIDNNGVLAINTTDSNFAHYQYELTKGKIYAFTGINTYLSRGLIIADSDNNIIYETTPVASNQVNPTSLIFLVKEDNLKAYMGIYKPLFDNANYSQFFGRYNTPNLREVAIFTNNYKKIEPRQIKKIEGVYLSWAYDSYGLPRVYTYEGTNEYIYEIVKGKKYKVHAWDWSNAVGIYLLGLDNEIIYQSTESGVGNTYVERTYEFTASVDGYVCLLERGNYKGTVEIIEDLIGESESSNEERLGFTKWYCLGDSLTEVNFRASKNYVGYITEELGITSVNLGHSSCGYMHTVNEQNFRTEISEISNTYNYDTDIITVMGSINDFQHIANIGQMGDTGTDTIYGCMYNFCEILFSSFIGARIGIITPPPTNQYVSHPEYYTAYVQALKDTAKKYSIPVLDLSYESNLKPWIANFQTEFYTADGTGNTGQTDQVHPNSKGHWLIHNRIKDFIKTL